MQTGVHWRMCRCGVGCCVACAAAGCGQCGDRLGGEQKVTEEIQDRNDPQIAQRWEHGYGDTPPPAISPEQALIRREAIIHQGKIERDERRKETRIMVKRQVREGCRPARKRTRKAATRFITVNVTSAGPFKDAIRISPQMRNAVLCVQEHKLSGDSRLGIEQRAGANGYAGVVGDAYQKKEGNGGGIAVFMPMYRGRPAPGGDNLVEGRATFAIMDLRGDVIVGSVYGIASQPVAKQLPVWKQVVEYLRVMGMPFVIGGDLAGPAKPHEDGGNIGNP